ILYAHTGRGVVHALSPADPDGPSRAHLARRIRGAEDDRGRPIFVALPRRTAPDVAEQAIPGVADAAGHARQRPDLAVIGDADLAGAVVAALGIGPGIVALDADHKAAGKLVVAAGLRAAKPAVQRVFAERLAVKRAAGRAHDPVLRLRPQTARMAADVAAAPAPNRNERGRLIDGKAHVGRDRRAHQRNQRGRCEQEFPHHLAPTMRGAVCSAWAWNTVADQPHQRGFAQRRRRLSATENVGAVVACRALSQPQSDLSDCGPLNAELGQNPSWDYNDTTLASHILRLTRVTRIFQKSVFTETTPG